jgi:hypothetical protein
MSGRESMSGYNENPVTGEEAGMEHGMPGGAMSQSDFDEHVDKCLSMILHHEEIQKMSEIIKRIHSEGLVCREDE